MLSTPNIDLETVVQAQVIDPDVDQLRQNSSPSVAVALITTLQRTVLCGVSRGLSKPMVLTAQYYPTIPALTTHPGMAASVKPLSERFVRFYVKRDVSQWSGVCLQSQIVKIHGHGRPPLVKFPNPRYVFITYMAIS